MFSEDPAAQVAAAGRFVAFEDADPVLIADMPDDTLTRARTITAFAYPGLPPARIAPPGLRKKSYLMNFSLYKLYRIGYNFSQ